MDFNLFITRLDEESLQQIIGKSAISILNTLDTDLTRLTRLQTVLLNIYSAQELLLNKNTRNIFFDLLKENEAQDLTSLLNNGTATSDNYQYLKSRQFKNENDLNILFDYFELTHYSPPETETFISQSELHTSYPLFRHQRRAIRDLNDALYIEGKRVLLHMPTGAGKTRTAMNVICNHLRLNEPTTVVWFANSEELCDQAVEEFETAWRLLGDRQISVTRFWGNSNVDIGAVKDGFIVAGLAKMYSLLSRDATSISKLAAKCSLAIMDEAHMAIAPTYKLILSIITNFHSSLLGLSATPGRTWNNPDADEELANFFNKKKVTLQIEGYSNPVDYLVDEGYLARIKSSPLFYNNGFTISDKDIEYLKDYLTLPEKFLKTLSEDQQRNILITQKVEQLVKNHKRIILFALSVEHSNLLATILQARGINAFSITSNTEPTQRRRLIERYKSSEDSNLVLCNYGILTTGFDAPQTSCAVISRPTDSLVLYSQMVGRAIRGIKAGGNLEVEIVTVIDTALPGFDKIANAFFNWEDVWA